MSKTFTMPVTSLETSKKIYELLGWETNDGSGHICINPDHQSYNRKDCTTYCVDCPAYDLGYLLRKLPALTSIVKDYDKCLASWVDKDKVKIFDQVADTPEDAAAKLAIELFKQGILK